MQLIISFLKNQGIKNFEADCFLVKVNDLESTECIVLDYEFFVCEAGESLWVSNEDSIEFTLFQTDSADKGIEDKVFSIPVEDFSLEEVHKPKRMINVLNKDKVVFSIQGDRIF